jgi:outer membrane protein assembly factor BamB
MASVAVAASAAAGAPHASAQVPCVPPVCQPSPPPQNPPPQQEERPQSGQRPRPQLPVAGPGPIDGSVTERVDMGRSGAFGATDLVPPLAPRWSRRLPGPVIGSPLSSSGLAVVLSGRFLIALDLATGRERWRSSTLGASSAVLSDGRVVTTGRESGVEAFDLLSGRRLWHRPEFRIERPVLVAGGVVYAGAALSLDDGRSLYEDRDRIASASGLALDGQRLYGSDPCGGGAKDRGNLEPVWSHQSGCSTGSEGFTAVGDGHAAFHRHGNTGPDQLVLYDGASGAELTRFGAEERAPVLAPGLVVSRFGALEAHRRPGGELAWRLPDPRDEDGSRFLVEWDEVAPVAVGENAYSVSRHGLLSAVRLADGRRLWTTRLRADDSGYDSAGETRGQIGVGVDTLLVPGGRRLVAYANSYRPSRDGVDAGSAQAAVFFDEPAALGGLVGVGVRGARPRVALEVDRHPFGRLRRAGSVRPGADGFFGARVRVPVNTRFRAVLPSGARSRVFTVFAYPRVRISSRRTSATRGQSTVRVRGPRSVRLGGRSAVLYFLRGPARELRRLGGGRLAGRRGSASTTVGYALPAVVGNEDGLVVCVRGQARLGLGGARDPLVRRCGARRIRLGR